MTVEWDVAVLGAGIVGASTAWHLARQGARVVVIDATGPAAEASGASDGAVSVSSKKPGVLARLATDSLLYTRALAANGPLAGHFHPRPAWYFATSEAESAALDALAEKLATLAGPVGIGRDGGAALLAGTGAPVRRLVEITGEGHMTGYSACAAYLGDPGIARLWPARVQGLEGLGVGVAVVLSDGRRITAGRVVVAMGVQSPSLLAGLPVHPLAGHLIVTDRGPGALPDGALTAASYLLAKAVARGVLPDTPVVIDPLRTGQVLIGSSRVPEGDPSRIDTATLLRLVQRATQVWPALAARRVIRVFAGVRAAVTDGLPLVGPLTDDPRVIVATGFEGDGICLSALIGREVAAMALGLSPSVDLAALSPARFYPVRAVAP